MPLVIHSPHAAMGGEQVIRISNEDRPTRWITFHFESEADATEAHGRWVHEWSPGHCRSAHPTVVSLGSATRPVWSL